MYRIVVSSRSPRQIRTSLQLASLAPLLPDGEIEGLCRGLGHTWRNRRLPPGTTLRSMVYRALHPDHSIAGMLADLGARLPVRFHGAGKVGVLSASREGRKVAHRATLHEQHAASLQDALPSIGRRGVHHPRPETILHHELGAAPADPRRSGTGWPQQHQDHTAVLPLGPDGGHEEGAVRSSGGIGGHPGSALA